MRKTIPGGLLALTGPVGIGNCLTSLEEAKVEVTLSYMYESRLKSEHGVILNEIRLDEFGYTRNDFFIMLYSTSM